MTHRIPVGIFFALFTLSGFAGLIYQSIWSHYLKLFLGHAAYAQTLVLAIFMGGMALGSWLVSRYTDRIRNLLVGYAVAELGVGVLALVFHRLFLGATQWAFDSVLPALGSQGVDLFKWGLASLLILPASVLLGTTFPLMSAGILRVYPDVGGRALSMLYFTNSFGAALGVLASGFFLIDRVGLPGTIMAAGIANVLLAVVVWTIAKGVHAHPAAAAAPAAVAEAGRLARLVYLLAFLTGAASFIYEITWIRMLSLGLGASTHSFEVMLSAFILAMALGAFWFRHRIGRIAQPVRWLAGLLCAKALFALYAVWIYGDVLGFIGWVMQAVSRTDGGYTLTTLAALVASMIVMFPAAFCAGMSLPLATHILTSRGLGEGVIGRVYGANTAGCILGAVFATHFGMEALGVKGLTGAGAAIDLAAGVGVLALAAERAARPRALAAGAALFAAGVLVFTSAEMDLLRMASGVYRHGGFNDPALSKVSFYRDGKTATIAVVDSGTRRAIRTNGKPDASLEMAAGKPPAFDEATMILAAALTLALKPEAEQVANIGFGSGLTTHTFLGSPRVREVHSIEIERMMVEGARAFLPRNRRAYEDPRSRIHIEDAKTFFASEGRRFEIIVSEPSNPWVSGVSTLFSEEFYAHVKRYLSADGVLMQWVQAYEIDVGLLSSIFVALGRHFADYTVYTTNGSDLLVVATPTGRLPPLDAKVFSYDGVREDLHHLGFRGVEDLENQRVGGRRALEALFLASGTPANSDFFPILDQRAPRARFRNANAMELSNIRDSEVPVMPLLDAETRASVERLKSAGRDVPTRVGEALQAALAVELAESGAGDRITLRSPQLHASALMVHALRGDCTGRQRAWVDAMYDVGAPASTWLEASATDAFFRRARDSACARSLAPAQSLRFGLLLAMADRDADAMAAIAEAALRSQPEAPTEDVRRFVMAAMAGHMARGRLDAAARVYERHVARLASLEPLPLGLRLMAAHLRLARPPQ